MTSAHGCLKPKFLGSGFLVASSYSKCSEDVVNMLRGNKAGRTCPKGCDVYATVIIIKEVARVGRVPEDATRMLRGNCSRGIYV